MDDGLNNIVPYRSPNAGEEATQVLGMVIFLCGWAMLFCGLFMAYGVIRSSTHPWPPLDEPRLPRGLGLVGTAAILLATASYQVALGRLRGTGGRRSSIGFVLALALTSSFVAIQVLTLAALAAAGLTLGSSAYGSIVLTLIGFHLLQVLVGLGAQILICVKTARGLYSAARLQPVRLWGMYLHAVTAIWCITFVAVYLV